MTTHNPAAPDRISSAVAAFFAAKMTPVEPADIVAKAKSRQQLAAEFKASKSPTRRSEIAAEVSRRNLTAFYGGSNGDPAPAKPVAKPAAKPVSKVRPEHRALIDAAATAAVRRATGR